MLHKAIAKNQKKSRREWMLWIACPDSETYRECKELS